MSCWSAKNVHSDHCGRLAKRDQNTVIASCISMSLQVPPGAPVTALAFGLIAVSNPERWNTWRIVSVSAGSVGGWFGCAAVSIWSTGRTGLSASYSTSILWKYGERNLKSRMRGLRPGPRNTTLALRPRISRLETLMSTVLYANGVPTGSVYQMPPV